ncbi:hypothetical protein PIB30_080295 [Stylosanthes scabra]|uniref:Uncharacterized protein n=1 Tax=Stylosanthes scabra TaxID=79078 RepID=A0ABU6TSR6_9FABA|nr:hypothetical protein [Stylosanthes scabra]
MVESDNKYETIFQLRGPKTIEAMRYNFLTMAPQTCVDIQMVTIMCHVLNREELPRFERDVYCVPPILLSRMFHTYGTNYLEKKTKMPYLMTGLKDHEEHMQMLDMDKLKSHTAVLMNDNHYGIEDKHRRIQDIISKANNKTRRRVRKL